MAFKSEIHVAELASIRTGHAEGDIYYILDNGMLGDLPCKPGTFVKWHNGTWQILPGEHYALGSAIEAVEEQVEALGQPLQWKGPATVTQLNDGITGIQPGWTYTLTDAGTLNYGTVVVDVGDEVAWTEDGEWFKLGGDQLVKTDAIAPEFSEEGSYSVGDLVTHDGKLYSSLAIQSAVVWDDSNWSETSVAEQIGNVEALLAAL